MKKLNFIPLLALGWPFAVGTALAADPFAGVSENKPVAEESPDFFSDNFGFRKELMFQFGADDANNFASRQSLGFETLKKFSTDTATVASVDFQGRLVRRDGFVGTINDLDGADRAGWAFEYHNVYADLYSLWGTPGLFNFRAGHFYVPFGLNLATDTHGTILQLSNQRNFGYDRDWYTGFWGSLSRDLNYDAYYLMGSGYEPAFRGQSGLGAARLSLGSRFAEENGLEGGLSFMGGQRLVANVPVDTLRYGLDGRYRQSIPGGTLTWASELSAGQDASDALFTQLHQLDYLTASRQFGLSAQFRRFWQDFSKDPAPPGSADSSLFTEVTWYFRNDVGNSNLQWVKFNVEWQLERQEGNKAVLFTLQYYQYW